MVAYLRDGHLGGIGELGAVDEDSGGFSSAIQKPIVLLEEGTLGLLTADGDHELAYPLAFECCFRKNIGCLLC